ncbi:uncharacterized protein LOC124676608 [Lolium rigidum]|uniref:uncharacterized protein LOC124676608 n=1 Tax=Lolium rigidum TaxID=89674 RepID=UPI001F5E32F1|nr:uncharacterized protein LOC124676608 [Lolium rigidum]
MNFFLLFGFHTSIDIDLCLDTIVQVEAVVIEGDSVLWRRYLELQKHSFYDSSGTGAWGFIARTDQGEAIGAGAEACVAAVEATADLGILKVIFEYDSEILVSALKSTCYDFSSIGILVREARCTCIVTFDFCDFVHCGLAHTIADYGYTNIASTDDHFILLQDVREFYRDCPAVHQLIDYFPNNITAAPTKIIG